MVLELKFDSISELAELQRLAVQADKPVYICLLYTSPSPRDS